MVSISFRDVVYAANLQAVLKRCHVRISGDNLFNGYDNTSAVRQIEIVIRKHNVRIAKGQADALCKRIGGKPVSYTHLDVYKRQSYIIAKQSASVYSIFKEKGEEGEFAMYADGYIDIVQQTIRTAWEEQKETVGDIAQEMCIRDSSCGMSICPLLKFTKWTSAFGH